MLDRLTHWLKTYGDTGDVSFKDFKEGVSESTFGDVNAIKSVLTTGGTIQDWLAVAMNALDPSRRKRQKRTTKQHYRHPYKTGY
ncbi:hypothetical protein [Capnocytophaga canimorsus]|uniref:Uncharacterized protein n=1 Tax=Capnocytophaga canimorsus (strain 5) TaxID=860228 RepID=F9YS68_CAPCC|nr:hypothetical protein [Capnocytophaga canimorsus]AEK22621.1 Hypothetical protein Ccan_05010 [Capnocytophaga canimorsus Cc5]GJQ03710.1 hypothetical protein CAPN009_01250 [Capnocytophaga canimorsus]